MYDLASVKRWLGIPAADVTNDADIEALMARALYAVERELDWYFGLSQAADEVLDGPGMRALWIRQPPVTGGVIVYDRSGVKESWAVYDADNYEHSGRGLFNVGNWTRGVRNWRVVYTEGFDPMPGDIEQLLLDLVKAKWEGRGTIPGMKSETIGDYSYTRGDMEETANWFMVLARWRRGKI